MQFTGERFVPSKYGMIALQHFHRYQFVQQIADLTDKVILDIACGEGYGSFLLSKEAKKVIGVDIATESIQSAKNHYKRDNIDFLVGDAAKIPLPDNAIDIVVSFETIEHHNKHHEMLAEIKRVLHSDGVLIISSPDKLFYEKNYPGKKNEFHVKELYKEEFYNLLKKYFKNNNYYLQNNVFGSFIAKEKEDEKRFEYIEPYYYDKENERHGALPSRFNIAIASDQEIRLEGHSSIYTYNILTDPYSQLLSTRRELEAIVNSKSWRFYNVLMKPLRYIKKNLSL